MALIDKLTAIANGFRASRGTTQAYTLDEMAELAAVPLGSGTAPEDLTAELTEQEALLEELRTTLEGKASGGGGFADPLLPEGYVRADYIQFTGDQTVDTGIVPTQDTKIRLIYTRESSDSMYLYGVVNSDNTASVTAYLSSGGSWRFGNKYSAASIVTNEDLAQAAIVSKTAMVRTGSTVTISGVTDFTAIGSLIIGGTRLASGSVGAAQFVGKIALFQMWSGSTEVLHLIPVVNADGVYRFWDSIGQEFHDSLTTIQLGGGSW